ncbi:MAG: hypothetical protein D6790_22070, partial [Caldilineae bacterium]
TPKDPATRLDTELQDFLLERQARGLSPRTISYYTRSLAPWRDFLLAQNVTNTEAVTPIHVRRFLVHLAERGHSPGGVVTIFTGVRAFLRWYAQEYAPTDWNPLAKVQAPKRPKERLDPLSLSHFQAMLATCTRRPQPEQPVERLTGQTPPAGATPPGARCRGSTDGLPGWSVPVSDSRVFGARKVGRSANCRPSPHFLRPRLRRRWRHASPLRPGALTSRWPGFLCRSYWKLRRLSHDPPQPGQFKPWTPELPRLCTIREEGVPVFPAIRIRAPCTLALFVTSTRVCTITRRAFP